MIFQNHYRLVSEEHHTEYILLETLPCNHLGTNLRDNYWGIHDTLKLFLKVDSGLCDTVIKRKEQIIRRFWNQRIKVKEIKFYKVNDDYGLCPLLLLLFFRW